ncbi:MAG: hypothetical protein K9L85_03625 [Candidatus Peribacteraceae bacterium]|nr:hypothetical protein [Candidatus Peribacteraceae bacterium]
MKTKNKKSESKKLYNLLSDAEVISDGERMFWLENFENLSENAKTKLTETLKSGERDLQKEHDAHAARVAEIDTKVVAELQSLAKASGLKGTTGDDDDIDYDEEEIIRTLQQAGEL